MEKGEATVRRVAWAWELLRALELRALDGVFGSQRSMAVVPDGESAHDGESR